MQRITNPKRASDKLSRPTWYNYHASYSERFVDDVLSSLELTQGSTVLDPWNGTGTTTSIAYQNKLRTEGLDINPALVLIAKARVLHLNVVESLEAMADDLVSKVNSGKFSDNTNTEFEALELWFLPQTANLIRQLEKEVFHLLIDSERRSSLFHYASLEKVSSIAALFYVALFRTVRDFVEPRFMSNPIWIKQAKTVAEKLLVSPSLILANFKVHIKQLSKNLLDGSFETGSSAIRIDFGTCETLPYESTQIDAVITSPPYCTRIDYAIATLPELAVLGFDSMASLKRLRDQMTGTPTIVEEGPSRSDLWGSSCTKFLESVNLHESRAARSYYLKFYTQYFASLSKSICEIDRVLKSSAKCVIVVQDSYFKDVHTDLPQITYEMADAADWKLANRFDFAVKSNYADSNIHSRQYRKISRATEAVLVFEKR